MMFATTRGDCAIDCFAALGAVIRWRLVIRTLGLRRKVVLVLVVVFVLSRCESTRRWDGMGKNGNDPSRGTYYEYRRGPSGPPSLPRLRLTFSVILKRLVLLLQLPQQPGIYLHGGRHHAAVRAASASFVRAKVCRTSKVEKRKDSKKTISGIKNKRLFFLFFSGR